MLRVGDDGGLGTGLPEWAQEHIQSSGGGSGYEPTLRDFILEVAHFFGWTWDQVLDLPVQRFWSTVEWLGQRRAREAEASKRDPLGSALKNQLPINEQ